MGESGIDVETQHPTRTLDPDVCRRVLLHVAEREGVQIFELTLILADHATVHELNRQYLDHDYRTDVLAFGYGENEKGIDGEIYVDLDTAAERHAEFGAGFEDEALRYAVHGLLHLIGYLDESDSQKVAMHTLEDRYLEEARESDGS